MLVITWAI